MPIFIFRTSSGREKGVAEILRKKSIESPRFKNMVWSIIVSEHYRGYIIVEGDNLKALENIASTVRGINNHPIQSTAVDIEELSSILVPKKAADKLKVGDRVEVINGPFKGSSAVIVSIEGSSQKIVAEISESMMNLPITIHADDVRKVSD